MFSPLLIGFIYFAIKAYRLKESIWFYGIVFGLGTGFITFLLTLVLKLMIASHWIGNINEVTFYVLMLLLTGLAIYIVDRWSGLSWYVDEYAEKKSAEMESESQLSDDELAKIRSMEIESGIDQPTGLESMENDDESISDKDNE